MRRAVAALIGLCIALGAGTVHAADPAPDLAALRRQADASADSKEKADALAELAKRHWQTDPDAALRLAEQGLQVAERLRYDQGRALSLNAAGVVHYLRGDFARAQPLLEQSLTLHEATGNPKGAGAVASNLAHLHATVSRSAEAIALYERAAKLGEQSGDDAGVATAKDGMGNLLQAQGRFREAIALYEESLRWSARAGDEQSRANTLNNLANARSEAGDTQAALRGYLEAAEIFEKLNLPLYQALAYANVAPILTGQGMIDQGRVYLERALAIQRRAGNRPAEGGTLLNLGQLENEAGRTAESVAAYEAARRIFGELGDRKSESIALHNLGQVANDAQRRGDAIAYLRQALALREAVSDRRGALSSRIGLGHALAASGRLAEAQALLEGALAESRRLEVPELEAEARMRLFDANRRAGRLAAAIEHLVAYVALRDRLLSASSQEKIAEMQTRFESERSAREIQVLQRDKEIQALVLHRQELLRNALVAMLVLLALLAAVAVSRYRLKKRSAAALQEKNLLLEQANREIERERDKSEQLLLNVLPPSIAGRLKDDRATIADRYSEATILFADLVGFTRLSQQMDADALVRLLNDTFTRFDALTDTYGLEKIKTIGDCYMAVGGVPERRPGHCEAVAAMALDMIREIDAQNAASGVSLRLRIGINTGAVVAGVIGRKKFIYDLWGDAVNTASRMESSGEPSRIHVTAAVVEAIGHLYRFEERGEIEVKGKGPMRTWFLVGPRESAA